MPGTLSLRTFLNLASKLRHGLRIQGEAGDLFFNPVKIVKFIRILAFNMNNIVLYAVRDIFFSVPRRSAC